VSIHTLLIKIDPTNVYFLRFILEGYDNMYVLSTIDKKEGLVEIQYCACAQKELKEILLEIGDTIGIKTDINNLL